MGQNSVANIPDFAKDLPYGLCFGTDRAMGNLGIGKVTFLPQSVTLVLS